MPLLWKNISISLYVICQEDLLGNWWSELDVKYISLIHWLENTRWVGPTSALKKKRKEKMNKSWASNEVLKIGKFSLNFITSQIFAQFRVQNWKILKTRNDEELVGEFVTEISYKSLLTACRHTVWKVILKYNST